MAHTPEKSRPPASKLKRIYAPRLISDHIMVQEDFERLHKFLVETEGLKSPTICESWSRRSGRLAADESRADDCSPSCCRPKAD